MSESEAINTIYLEAINKMKMKEGQASQYVGEVISFHIRRLSFHLSLNPENLKKALIDEAEFHIKAPSQDVA